MRVRLLAPGPGTSAISRPAIGQPSLSRTRTLGIRRPERRSSTSKGSRPPNEVNRLIADFLLAIDGKGPAK